MNTLSRSVSLTLGLMMLPLTASAQRYARPAPPPPVVVAQPMMPPAMPAPMAQPGQTTTVYTTTAPPRGRVERHGRPPVAGQNWIPGFWSWNGSQHVWTPGRWEAPPRPRARWVEPRWVRRGGRWEMQPGRWR
ncbi:MAG: YXWGXW repeat-containing protein [Myxococcales bacterium]|nr:YXWGXW repeat-containing protein [Myxococcales bacterium]